MKEKTRARKKMRKKLSNKINQLRISGFSRCKALALIGMTTHK